MLRQVGQATDVIINVQEYLELPPKAKFRDIVSNEKLRAGIDGVIDQELVALHHQENRYGSAANRAAIDEPFGQQRFAAS